MRINRFRLLRYLTLGVFAIFSCKNEAVTNIINAGDIDSLDLKKNYPSEIRYKHLEKKYDNAIWLFYASNYHAKIGCYFKNKKQSNDTSVITLEPLLYSPSNNNKGVNEIGDTVELELFFRPLNDSSCICETTQYYFFCVFGFLKQYDSVVYRNSCSDGGHPYHATMMQSRKDFNKRWGEKPKLINGYYIFPDGTKIAKKDILADSKELSEEEKYEKDLRRGWYPIDVQDSLFRVYVKAHKNQLAPTLLRLCKEKNVF